MQTERHENFERLSMGPQISKNQRYTCYKKQNSEVSIQSEQREKQSSLENQNLIYSKSSDPIHKLYQKQAQTKKLNIQKNSQNEKKPTNNFFSLLLHKQLVNRFVQNLYQASYILPKKFKFLGQEIYISSEQKIHQPANEELFNKKIFYPGNNFLLYWNLIVLLINMISLWLSPFIVTFKYQSSKLLYIFLIIFLLFDILVNLNKSIIFQGEIITNRVQIIKHYIKGNAFYDIVSLFLWIENFVDSVLYDQQEAVLMIQVVLTGKKTLTIFDNVLIPYIQKEFILA